MSHITYVRAVLSVLTRLIKYYFQVSSFSLCKPMCIDLSVQVIYPHAGVGVELQRTKS